MTLARYEDDGLIVLAHRATDTHLRVGQRVPMQLSDRHGDRRPHRPHGAPRRCRGREHPDRRDRCAGPASARPSPRPSSSTVAPGACWRRAGRTPARRPRTPRSGWRASPSCSTRRSPTRTAGISSRRLGRGCSQPVTTPVGGWSATCTTARNSGSCTRSSRSSSPGGRSRRVARTLNPCSRRRWRTPSARTPRCASWRTASSPSVLTRGGLRAGVRAFV